MERLAICRLAVVLACGLLCNSPSAAQPLPDFIVTTSSDLGDAAPGDGVCATFVGSCSLRAAIEETNAAPVTRNIRFAVAEVDVCLFGPSLPAITQRVHIDGASHFSRVWLRSYCGAGAVGLELRADSSTVDNLIVTNFSTGVRLASNSNRISNSYIGTNEAGASGLANIIGIEVLGDFNEVGDSVNTPANVISGNGIGIVVAGDISSPLNNTIVGNYIGKSALGTAAIPNVYGGIVLLGTDGTTIGPYNEIAGNGGTGIAATDDTGSSIHDNVIGVLLASQALRNHGDGIALNGSSHGMILGNLIAGNDGAGISAQNMHLVTIDNNSVLTNALVGIDLIDSANNYIDDNTIGGNGKMGIQLTHSDQNFIIENQVGNSPDGGPYLGNGSAGIRVQDSGTNNIAGNSILGNVSIGIEMADAHDSYVETNVVSDNGGTGILLLRGVSNTVRGNKVGTNAAGDTPNGNANEGIKLLGSSNNQIGGELDKYVNIVAANVGAGIRIAALPGGPPMAATNNLIQGNRIGVGAPGFTAGMGNSGAGVALDGTSGPVADNTIGGGISDASGNVISQNGSDGVSIVSTTGTQVTGNRIGTNAAATTALPNAGNGIFVNNAADTLIGGALDVGDNVISGNTGNGISLNGACSNTRIWGNFIGTNVDGSIALPNQGSGITSNNTASTGLEIGGHVSGRGNVISGNKGFGADITGILGGNFTMEGNLVGTRVDGLAALGNQNAGLRLSGSGILVGGSEEGSRNVISGNGSDGVVLQATSSTLLGNLVGIGADNLTPLPNAGHGIRMGIPSAQTVELRNVIAYNTGAGVAVQSLQGHRLAQNAVFANGGLGIDLNGDGVTPNDAKDIDGGSNNLQNFPLLTAADLAGATLTVTGTLNSIPNSGFTVEFFYNSQCDASGNGEGQTYLGSVTTNTDANGSGNFAYSNSNATGAQLGGFITATAAKTTSISIDAADTSEFSSCRVVVAAPNTATASPTITPTRTSASTTTPTFLTSSTPTNISTASATATRTPTASASRTFSSTSTITPTQPTSTATQTLTTTASRTPTQTATRTPTRSDAPVIGAGFAVARPGGKACVPVGLSTGGVAVASTGNTLLFGTNYTFDRCLISPTIGSGTAADKQLTLSLSGFARRVTIGGNATPLTDGLLYTCEVTTGAALTPGVAYSLANINVSATAPDGNLCPSVTSVYATVLITNCPGDCDGDGVVSVGEVQRIIDLGLGQPACNPVDPSASCPVADVNSDGAVTLGEIAQGVEAFLNGCP